MDILAFKNYKRKSASRRLMRLLNRHCALSYNAGERRGDSRVLYPQPACIIPLKDGKFPLLEGRCTVFLSDLSSTGVSFYCSNVLATADLILCFRAEDDADASRRASIYIRIHVRQSAPGEEGLIRAGCEIMEEIRPQGAYAMLPLAFAPKSGGPRAAKSLVPDTLTEAIERLYSRR